MAKIELTPSTRLVVIDIARGAAAMAVLLYHALPILSINAAHPQDIFEGNIRRFYVATNAADIILYCLFGFGFLGVQLFFVLSGFCIHLPQAQGRPFITISYWIRRFFRIYPLYFVVSFVLFLVAFMLHQPAAQWRNVLGHVVFWHYEGPVSSDGMGISSVMWTLALEVQFYVLYGLLYPVIRKVGLKRVTWVWLAFDISYRILFLVYLNGAGLPAIMRPNRFALPRFGEWLLGAVLAEDICKDRSASLSRKTASTLAVGLLFGGVLLGGFVSLDKYQAMDIPASVAFYLILRSLLRTESESVNSVHPVTALLGWVGMLSYSVYLIHDPFLSIANALVYKILGVTGFFLWPERLTLWTFDIAGIMVVSWVAFRLIESPTHELGRRICKRIEHAPAE